MAKRGYESQKTGQKVDDLLDKIDNLNVPEWALQANKPSYTAQEVHALPENTSIPKKTSDLVNDRGFITQESDPTVPSWAKEPSKPRYTAQEVCALPEDTPLFSGDYNDLRNKPTIPTVPENVSAFNNDAGYLTDEDMGDYATKQELQGKQDTINDLASIRSGASAGATAYQKPQAGIPESDLSQGVKDKMNEKEVFWATYGTTTAAEIDAAVAAGKQILCVNGGYVHIYAGASSNYHYFFAIVENIAYRRIQLQRTNSGWTFHNLGVERTSDKVSSWSATPNNTHYPSEKLVKDSLDVKAGISDVVYDVSAKNTTAGHNNDGKFESLSALLSDANINTLIPIAVRKGGMSIKFVQSSDNKYVQFRYIQSDAATVATFTNVANWEKETNTLFVVDIKGMYLYVSDAIADGLTVGDYYYYIQERKPVKITSTNPATFERENRFDDNTIYKYNDCLYKPDGYGGLMPLEPYAPIKDYGMFFGLAYQSNGAMNINNARASSGKIYKKCIFSIPTSYVFTAVRYFNLSDGTYNSSDSLTTTGLSPYAIQVGKDGCYAIVVIRRSDNADFSEADRIALMPPSSYNDNQLENVVDIETKKLDGVVNVMGDALTAAISNTSRYRNESGTWSTNDSLSVVKVGIPSDVDNVFVRINNNKKSLSYMPYWFSVSNKANDPYITGNYPVIYAFEEGFVDVKLKVPFGAKFLYLATDYSGSVGDVPTVDKVSVISLGKDYIIEEKKLVAYEDFSGYVNYTNGQIETGSARQTAIIDVSDGEYSYIRTYQSDFTGDYGYGFVLNDGSWVGVHTTKAKEVIIPIPENAATFKMAWSTDYIRQNYFYLGKKLPVNDISTKKKCGFQFIPDFDLSRVPAYSFIPLSSDVDDVYDKYDALVSSYPDYVSKVDCSDADSVLGITRPAYLNGLPIYMYHFKPKANYSETNSNAHGLKKVFIITGVHSGEKMGIYTTYMLMKMLCENWKNDINAEQLRTLVEFYVIPIVNPWGFENCVNPPVDNPYAGRTNGNGVNLNRNFPSPDWNANGRGTTDVAHGNYPGASAGSEYETKIVCYYAEQAKPDVFFDWHTGNMNVRGEMGTINFINSDEGEKTAVATARSMSNRLIKDNSDFPDNPNTVLISYGCFDIAEATGTTYSWGFEKVTPLSFLTEQCVETKWLDGVLTNVVQSSNTDEIFRENLQFSYDMLMRAVYTAYHIY